MSGPPLTSFTSNSPEVETPENQNVYVYVENPTESQHIESLSKFFLMIGVLVVIFILFKPTCDCEQYKRPKTFLPVKPVVESQPPELPKIRSE